ncbi:hypothetical protein Plhal304r1_c018g0065981 [Plasmopara halstedii]
MTLARQKNRKNATLVAKRIDSVNHVRGSQSRFWWKRTNPSSVFLMTPIMRVKASFVLSARRPCCTR